MTSTKKMWRLNLFYNVDREINEILSDTTILGVDIGVCNPIVASVFGNKTRFTIHGSEILAFQRKTENRKKELQHQTCYCGLGRVGHGRKKRNKPAQDIGNKVNQFRETTNFKYAKALIDFAIRQHCGIIQMEDLTGIRDRENSFLKNWSYYDLQTKIINKANEKGIKVVKVDPKYTSQRCSCCGNISSKNRTTQSNFQCISCGFTENADYNASQNLAIKNIDQIIQDTLDAVAGKPK